MDAMETRTGDGVAWFRLKHRIIEGAGPLSAVLGPADWTHGIARPLQNVVADPNPNLTVQLCRQPRGSGWVSTRKPAGARRPDWASAAAPCSTPKARLAAFRCR